MTSAFVAGATGYTGQAVVVELCARSVATTAHVRPDSNRLETWRARFGQLGATVDTTPWTQDAMNATLATLRPDVVFALLGTTRARTRTEPGASYETVDYGLTAMLLRACVDAGHRPRFVYLSSQGVTATTSNAYLAARWRLEQALRESGLPFDIARPSFITGEDREERRPAERVAAKVADGALALVGALGGARLRDKYASNTAQGLAHALVRAALEPTSGGRVLEGAALRT